MQRRLGDAKKLLALASAEDPEAAAEEAARRNREHQAKHRAKAGAYVSAEQLERKARVKAVVDKKERERIEGDLQKRDRQVADLLDAIKHIKSCDGRTARNKQVLSRSQELHNTAQGRVNSALTRIMTGQIGTAR